MSFLFYRMPQPPRVSVSLSFCLYLVNMSTTSPLHPLQPFHHLPTGFPLFSSPPLSYLTFWKEFHTLIFFISCSHFLLTGYQTSSNVPVMFFEIVNALKFVGSSLFIILDFINVFDTDDLAFYLKRHAWSLDFIILGSSGSWCALCLLFEQCTPSVSKSVISVSQHLRNFCAFSITSHPQFSGNSSNS